MTRSFGAGFEVCVGMAEKGVCVPGKDRHARAGFHP
jgi:hypothetical protein